MGEKWPVISAESCDFHADTFGFFYMPQICDMGQTVFTPLPKEGVLRIFFALKNPTASAGFEPANLGTKGQHAASRPPKPLRYCYEFDTRLRNRVILKDIFQERKKKVL